MKPQMHSSRTGKTPILHQGTPDCKFVEVAGTSCGVHDNTSMISLKVCPPLQGCHISGCVPTRCHQTKNASSVSFRVLWVFSDAKNTECKRIVLWTRCYLPEGNAISSYQFVSKRCHTWKVAEITFYHYPFIFIFATTVLFIPSNFQNLGIVAVSVMCGLISPLFRCTCAA